MTIQCRQSFAPFPWLHCAGNRVCLTGVASHGNQLPAATHLHHQNGKLGAEPAPADTVEDEVD